MIAQVIGAMVKKRMRGRHVILLTCLAVLAGCVSFSAKQGPASNQTTSAQTPEYSMVAWNHGPPESRVEHGGEKTHSGTAPPYSPKMFTVQPSALIDDVSNDVEQECKLFEQRNSNQKQLDHKNTQCFQNNRDNSLTINKQVQQYIRYFQTEARTSLRRRLFRSMRYKDLMQGILKEYHLPEDLFYVALIESGFDLNAHSPDHAVGPWQLIADTARRYGLKVDRRVDERQDPVKSTHAAAKYLSDLYKQFDCWYLAVAAYNTGEANIDRAIRRSKTRDFWELCAKGFVNGQTQRHVSKIVAAAIIARHPEKYGFFDLRYTSPHQKESEKILARQLSNGDELLPDYIPHTIQCGETLSSIARDYNTTVTALVIRNGITQPDQIRSGQTIMVLNPGSNVQGKLNPNPPEEFHAETSETFRFH